MSTAAARRRRHAIEVNTVEPGETPAAPLRPSCSRMTHDLIRLIWLLLVTIIKIGLPLSGLVHIRSGQDYWSET